MIPLLIVDDESIIRETIAAMVRRKYPEQFHIFLASNGREALSLVTSESVELVLADIKMPVMDGLQLLHCLHEQQLQCDVIFISGFDDYSFVREAMEVRRGGLSAQAHCRGRAVRPDRRLSQARRPSGAYSHRPHPAGGKRVFAAVRTGQAV